MVITEKWTKFFIFKFSFNYRNGPILQLDAKNKHAIVLCKFYAF